MNPQNLVKITFIYKQEMTRGDRQIMSIYCRENIYINYEDTAEKIITMYLESLNNGRSLDEVVAIEYLGKVFI